MSSLVSVTPVTREMELRATVKVRLYSNGGSDGSGGSDVVMVVTVVFYSCVRPCRQVRVSVHVHRCEYLCLLVCLFARLFV